MDKACAFVISEPHRKDLMKPAFDAGLKAGMNLYPIHYDDPVGLIGDLVKIDFQAVFKGAHLHNIHGRFDRHPHGFFGKTVLFQHFSLSLCSRTAVGAHGGEKKRLGPPRLYRVDNSLDDGLNVLNPPAADRNADLHTRFYHIVEMYGLKLPGHGLWNIVYLLVFKDLCNLSHPNGFHDLSFL